MILLLLRGVFSKTDFTQQVFLLKHNRLKTKAVCVVLLFVFVDQSLTVSGVKKINKQLLKTYRVKPGFFSYQITTIIYYKNYWFAN